MSGLKILVVGRGQGENNLPNGHSVKFIRTARSDSGFVSLVNFDFAFQHVGTSNPEAEEAIKYWQRKGDGSKVIALSGGKMPPQFSNLGVPPLEDVGSQETFIGLNWDAVPSNFSVSAKDLLELLKPQPRMILPALSILCQGYLAVHAAYGGPDKDWNDENITLALEQMGWKQLIEKPDMSQIVETLRGQHATTENIKDWWQPVLVHVKAPADEASRGTKEALIEQLRREWRKDSLPEEVSKLVETIYDTTPHSLTDVNLVARAYLKLAEKLKGGIS